MYISDTWGSVGEQSAATVNERASGPCFICEVREEPQLCGGTLSFVIRGGDRLSAVVGFGSNMSYPVRGQLTTQNFSSVASDDQWPH